MNELFKDIVKKTYILKEDAQIDDINSAILGMHPVMIKYDDKKHTTGKNKRLIYPVAYGLSTAGNPVVRAFQKNGSTSSFVPHWKLLRFDRIKSWRTINSKKFNPEDLVGFRKDGDDQISTLYSISPIGKAKDVHFDGNYVKLKSTPITRSDIKAENDPEYAKKLNTGNYQKSDRETAIDIVNDIVDNIDNSDKNSYNNEKWQEHKMMATDTDAIYANEIPGGDKEVTPKNKEQELPKTEIGNSPVSKKDLEKPETEHIGINSDENNDGEGAEENKNNPANDLTNRMNNL